MSREIITVEENRTVLDATKLMVKKGVGCLIIKAGVHLRGILTERDLVSRVLVESFDPAKVLAKDIMSTPLFTIKEDETLTKAADLMNQYRVRRLPVVDGKKNMVGLITSTDLSRSIAKGKRSQRR